MKILALFLAGALSLAITMEARADGDGPTRWVERMDIPDTVPAALAELDGEPMFCATADTLRTYGISTVAVYGCEPAVIHTMAVFPEADVCAGTTAGWCQVRASSQTSGG